MALVENKSVELAVAAKKEVEVALVEVALPIFRNEMVEEAAERKPFKNPRVVEVETP